MTRLVAAKMGIKPGSRVIFVNAPESTLELLGPPEIDGATDLQRHVRRHPLLLHDSGGSRRDVPEIEASPETESHGVGLLVEEVATWSRPDAARRHAHPISPWARREQDVERGCIITFTHPGKGKAYNNRQMPLPSRSSAETRGRSLSDLRHRPRGSTRRSFHDQWPFILIGAGPLVRALDDIPGVN